MPYLYLFKSLPTEDAELERFATEMGIAMAAITFAGRTGVDTYEVQRRLREVIGHRRASLAWILALLSALASLGSAVAAWVAAAGCRPG